MAVHLNRALCPVLGLQRFKPEWSALRPSNGLQSYVMSCTSGKMEVFTVPVGSLSAVLVWRLDIHHHPDS